MASGVEFGVTTIRDLLEPTTRAADAMYDLYPANIVTYNPTAYPNFNSFGSDFQSPFGYSIPNYSQCSFQESAAQSFSQQFSGFSERLPPPRNTAYSKSTEAANFYRGTTQREVSSTLHHFPSQQHEMELSPSGSHESEVLSENSSDQGTSSRYRVCFVML